MLKNILGIQNGFKLSQVNLSKTNFISNSIKAFGAYRSNPALSVPYEREKAEYKKARKEMNKKHIQDFWEEQTKVENEWLNEFMKEQKEKKRRDDAKMRTKLIKNAFKCYQNIQQEIENQKAFLAKQKLWREEDTQELLEKHSLLNILDRQAEEDWLTPENVDSKLSQQINKILPPTILSHVDYYKKLNKYALLMEAGLTEEAEEIKYNKKIIDYKNKLLQPIFEELKMVIRHLTYTEEHAVFSLYKETILRIENYLNPQQNKNDANYLKDNMTYLFKRLIALIRLENERADNKIEVIEKQLKALTMIMVLWNRYVEIIYKPESEIEEIMNKEKAKSEEFHNYQATMKNKTLDDLVEEKDPRVLKDYYMSRITDKKAKGSGMFIRDMRGLSDDPIIRKSIEDKLEPKEVEGQSERVKRIEKEEYTTESEEEEDRLIGEKGEENEFSEEFKGEGQKKFKGEGKKMRPQLAAETEKKTNIKKGQTEKKKKSRIHQEKRKMLENEAAEVFGDEEAFEDEGKEKTGLSEPTGQTEETETGREVKSTHTSDTSASTTFDEISDSFSDPLSSNLDKTLSKKPRKERKLLEEHMLMAVKRQVEQSKYSHLDVENELKTYKANLVKDLGLKDEKELFEDIDKELDEIDLSSVINMNEYENELKKENERLTLEKEFENFKKEDLFSSSLFDTLIKYSKNIFDFKNQKISTDLDIYDENLIKFLEYSVKESNIVHKSSSSSVIMEYIKEELEKIQDEELSPANRLKKKHLIKVSDVIGKMRVTDSQNLKRVFEVNKHPSIKF